MHAYFDPSANCFLNAFIREVDIWSFEGTDNSEPFSGKGTFSFTNGNETLLIQCEQYSLCGRHHLKMPATLTDQSGVKRSLGFTATANWLMAHPTIIKLSSLDNRQALMDRILDSDRNIQEAIQYKQAELPHLMEESVSFIESESSLFTGHSIHPCPKARDHFSQQDAVQYAPEYGNEFTLHWYQIERRHLFINLDELLTYNGVIEDLAQQDEQVTAWLDAIASKDSDFVLVPCHPFQHHIWQKHPWLQQLVDQNQLMYLGTGTSNWRATSSLRAIHNPNSPWMLKFSLSIKLTNSVRHLQPEELKRGVELCRVLAQPNAYAFKQAMSPFQIMMEPAAAAIKDEFGEPIPECMVLWRENPFENQTQDVEVLASLLQDDPRDGQPRLVKRLLKAGVNTPEQVQSWFKSFLNVAIEPLLIAQSNFGLLFGAHQQNLLVKFDGVTPVSAFFRDCQGTGFTELAKDWLGNDLQDLGADSENLIDTEAGMNLFVYYLFINSTFNVIASLSAMQNIQESDLLREYKSWLEALAPKVEDPSCINHLLYSDTLNAKGNFLCSIQNINENTSENPLAIYHPFPNPLGMLNQPTQALAG